MSKVLIYSIISSSIVIIGSATYFFPVVEAMHSLFHSESAKKSKPQTESNLNVPETQIISTKDNFIDQTDLNVENPKVFIDEDTINKLSKNQTNSI